MVDNRLIIFQDQTHMTKAQLNQCKQSLLKLDQENKELEKEFAKSGDIVKLDQSSVGRLTRMDAMQAQAMSVETGRLRRQKLVQIGATLKRIDADDFGYCEECGDDIASQRLEIDPTVLLCIDCASAKEL